MYNIELIGETSGNVNPFRAYECRSTVLNKYWDKLGDIEQASSTSSAQLLSKERKIAKARNTYGENMNNLTLVNSYSTDAFSAFIVYNYLNNVDSPERWILTEEFDSVEAIRARKYDKLRETVANVIHVNISRNKNNDPRSINAESFAKNGEEINDIQKQSIEIDKSSLTVDKVKNNYKIFLSFASYLLEFVEEELVSGTTSESEIVNLGTKEKFFSVLCYTQANDLTLVSSRDKSMMSIKDNSALMDAGYLLNKDISLGYTSVANALEKVVSSATVKGKAANIIGPENARETAPLLRVRNYITPKNNNPQRQINKPALVQTKALMYAQDVEQKDITEYIDNIFLLTRGLFILIHHVLKFNILPKDVKTSSILRHRDLIKVIEDNNKNGKSVLSEEFNLALFRKKNWKDTETVEEWVNLFREHLDERVNYGKLQEKIADSKISIVSVDNDAFRDDTYDMISTDTILKVTVEDILIKMKNRHDRVDSLVEQMDSLRNKMYRYDVLNKADYAPERINNKYIQFERNLLLYNGEDMFDRLLRNEGKSKWAGTRSAQIIRKGPYNEVIYPTYLQDQSFGVKQIVSTESCVESKREVKSLPDVIYDEERINSVKEYIEEYKDELIDEAFEILYTTAVNRQWGEFLEDPVSTILDPLRYSWCDKSTEDRELQVKYLFTKPFYLKVKIFNNEEDYYNREIVDNSFSLPMYIISNDYLTMSMGNSTYNIARGALGIPRVGTDNKGKKYLYLIKGNAQDIAMNTGNFYTDNKEVAAPLVSL